MRENSLDQFFMMNLSKSNTFVTDEQECNNLDDSCPALHDMMSVEMKLNS